MRVLLLLALAVTSLAPAVGRADAYRFPEPTERRLANGLRVVVFPSSRLEIVQMQLIVPAGLAAEPSGQGGVAHLAAELLRHGTTSRNPRQFELEVERIGGTVTTGVTRDLALVSGSFLSRDLEAGLDLMSDCVIQPIFDPGELESARATTQRQAAQAMATPAQVAEDQLWQLVFDGRPHAGSVLGDPASLERITRNQVVAFHAAHYRPDRAVLAIAGDVTPERAFQVAEDSFGAWSGTADSLPTRNTPPTAAGTRIRIVDRPVARTELRIGFPIPGRPSPEEISIPFAAALLGGAPASRPNGVRTMHDREVRTGVTFLRGEGLFLIAVSVPNDSVAAACAAFRKQLTALGRPASGADFEGVRRMTTQTFPLSFESLGAVASAWLAADFYGEPKDYFARYPDRVAALTPAQVAEVARKWLDPARMTVVAAGPAASLKPALASLGAVEVVDARPRPAAPDTVASEPPPTAAEIQRGRELIQKAAIAHGGLARMQKIRDSVIDAEITLTIGDRPLGGELSQTRKEPDRMLSVTQVTGAETRQTLIGNRGWQQTNGEPAVAMDSVAVAALREGFTADVPHLLVLASDPAARVYARGREYIDATEAEVVNVTAPSVPARSYFIDPVSHRLLGFDQREPGEGSGGLKARRVFSDFRPVGELLWPYGENRLLNGRPLMKVRATHVALDTGVPDSKFVVPGASAPR